MLPFLFLFYAETHASTSVFVRLGSGLRRGHAVAHSSSNAHAIINFNASASAVSPAATHAIARVWYSGVYVVDDWQ